MNQSENSKIKKFWLKLVLVPVAMFGFSYAMVPMYDLFCEITGLNGKTGRVESQEQNYEVDEQRLVTVNFISDVSSGFPVEFYPETKSMQVVPGQFYQLNYVARSISKDVIVGQAIPSVAPLKASLHFNKVVCFCFNNQTFEPMQTVKMPINFVVEPELADDVYDITLSYKFFRITPEA